MTDFIGIDITGTPEIASKLDGLANVYGGYGVEASNEYIIRSLQSSQPPYKSVSRAEAWPNAPYKPGYFSKRQHRYVMAKIASGEIKIPYQRTQTLRKNWKTAGIGENQIVVNETSYAKYVYDDYKQANMMMLRNWDIISTFLRDRMDRITKAFDEGVRKAVNKFGFLP